MILTNLPDDERDKAIVDIHAAIDGHNLDDVHVVDVNDFLVAFLSVCLVGG